MDEAKPRLGRARCRSRDWASVADHSGKTSASLDDETAAGALEAAWDSGSAPLRHLSALRHRTLRAPHRGLLCGKPREEVTFVPEGRSAAGPAGPGGPDGRELHGATHRRVWDFTRDGILNSMEDSLERMGVDRIDMLFLHDAEPSTNRCRPALHRGLGSRTALQLRAARHGATCRGCHLRLRARRAADAGARASHRRCLRHTRCDAPGSWPWPFRSATPPSRASWSACVPPTEVRRNMAAFGPEIPAQVWSQRQ